MITQRDLYMRVLGHGKLSIRQFCSVQSSTIGEATLEFVSNPEYLEGWEGAQVYIGLSEYPQVPLGYYTLVSVDSGANEAVIRGSKITAGAVPGDSISIRVQDFYKISTGIPDFVTGDLARSMWIPVVSDATTTIGQKVDLIGGISTSDGVTISAAYTDVVGFREIVRLTPEVLTSEADANIPIYTSASALPSADSISINAAVVAESVPGSVYDGVPLWLGNAEAIQIISDGIPTTPSIERGVLGTGYWSYYDGDAQTAKNGVWVPSSTLLHHGLPSGIGARVEILRYGYGSMSYDDHKVIYYGLLDGITFDQNINVVNFELSSSILTGYQSTLSSKFGSSVTINPDGVPGTNGVLLPTATLYQSVDGPAWKWIKLGDACLKMRNQDLTVPVSITVGDLNPSTGLVEATYPVDKIVAYVDSAGVIDPLNLKRGGGIKGYTDNWVVDKYFDNLGEFQKFVPYGDLDSGDSDIITQSGSEALIYRDGLFVNASSKLYVVERKALRDLQASMCHVFESIDDFVGPTVRWTPTAPRDEYVTYRPRIGVYELILQVLTSVDGLRANGIFDVLPPGVGLGIPVEKIDLSSFGLTTLEQVYDLDTTTRPYWRSDLSLDAVVISLEDTAKISEWLAKEILKPFGLVLAQDIYGRITLQDAVKVEVRGLDPIFSVSDSILADEEGRVDIAYSYDSSKIFSSISHSWKAKGLSPSGYSVDVSQTVRSTIPTAGGAAIQILSYPTQAAPIEYKMAYSPLYTLESGVSASMVARASGILALYSRTLPTITLTIPSDVVEVETGSGLFVSYPAVGSLVSINLSNAIGSDGSRGVAGYGVVSNLVRDVIRDTYRATISILPDQRVPTQRTWGDSAYVTGYVGGDKSILSISSLYGDVVDNIQIGDQMVLYNPYFTLLSITGGGAQRPQTVTNVSDTEIEFDASFKDGSGVEITPTDGMILCLSMKSDQATPTQDYEAWMNDGVSAWR